MRDQKQTSVVSSLSDLLSTKFQLNDPSSSTKKEPKPALSDIDKALKAMKNYPNLAENHNRTPLGDSFSISAKIIKRYYIQLIHRDKIARYLKQSKYKFLGNKISHEKHQRNVQRLVRKRILNAENIMGYRTILKKECEKREEIKKGSN